MWRDIRDIVFCGVVITLVALVCQSLMQWGYALQSLSFASRWSPVLSMPQSVTIERM